MTDNAWLRTYDKYFKDTYSQLLKSGETSAEAIAQAFQMTVDLDKHPYSSEPIPANQRMLTLWAEAHIASMDETLCIAIINPPTSQIGVIRVQRKWLCTELHQWLIDNKHYDYFYEIPDDEDELIEIFLFCYCDYNQSQLHWQMVPDNTKFQDLTPKDYQK